MDSRAEGSQGQDSPALSEQEAGIPSTSPSTNLLQEMCCFGQHQAWPSLPSMSAAGQKQVVPPGTVLAPALARLERPCRGCVSKCWAEFAGAPWSWPVGCPSTSQTLHQLQGRTGCTLGPWAGSNLLSLPCLAPGQLLGSKTVLLAEPELPVVERGI